MKILWLSHFLPYPPKGGALQRSHNLLLQASGRHEIHLVSLNQRSVLPTPSDVEEAVGFLGKHCRTVKVFPIPADSAKWRWTAMTMASYIKPTPYDVNWLRNGSMDKFLADLSENRKFDLVHVDTIGLYPCVSAFGNTPIVLNHHNVESQMMRRRFEKETGAIKRIYFHREADKLKRMERNVCGKCAMNLVVSDLDGERLKENTGDVRTAVIPNGVDIDFFRPGNPEGDSRKGLIFAGGMDWYPNREAVLFFLRDIWPRLIEDKPGRRATILGKNPPEELLEAAKSSPFLTVPGFVDDVRPYIDSAGIYICPIRDGGGTRLKILDALAMGKPLVATEMAVEGLDLVKGIHYLEAETGPDFVEQINRLENDPVLSRNLADAGRQFVQERFGWSVIGKKLEIAYRDAIKGDSSAGKGKNAKP